MTLKDKLRSMLRKPVRMSADEDAFRAHIAAHPDDDAPKLVYSDWLEERGDGERAESIRRVVATRRHMEAINANLSDPAPKLEYAKWLHRVGQPSLGRWLGDHARVLSGIGQIPIHRPPTPLPMDHPLRELYREAGDTRSLWDWKALADAHREIGMHHVGAVLDMLSGEGVPDGLMGNADGIHVLHPESKGRSQLNHGLESVGFAAHPELGNWAHVSHLTGLGAGHSLISFDEPSPFDDDRQVGSVVVPRRMADGFLADHDRHREMTRAAQLAKQSRPVRNAQMIPGNQATFMAIPSQGQPSAPQQAPAPKPAQVSPEPKKSPFKARTGPPLLILPHDPGGPERMSREPVRNSMHTAPLWEGVKANPHDTAHWNALSDDVAETHPAMGEALRIAGEGAKVGTDTFPWILGGLKRGVFLNGMRSEQEGRRRYGHVLGVPVDITHIRRGDGFRYAEVNLGHSHDPSAVLRLTGEHADRLAAEVEPYPARMAKAGPVVRGIQYPAGQFPPADATQAHPKPKARGRRRARLAAALRGR